MGGKARVGEGQRWSGLDVILYISTVKYLHKVPFKWECIQRFLGVETANSLRYSKVVAGIRARRKMQVFFYSQGKARLSLNLGWSLYF